MGKPPKQRGNDLAPMAYDELRRLARYQMDRLEPGHTLQPTALVHEAYLRLARTGDSLWNDEQHFVAAAARTMRFILVDEARRKSSIRRGGRCQRVFVDDVAGEDKHPIDLLVVDEAARLLEEENEQAAEILDLRLFGGLTLAETARATGISVDMAKREWRFVKSWLCAHLSDWQPGNTHADS